jgi:hypothetical protein
MCRQALGRSFKYQNMKRGSYKFDPQTLLLQVTPMRRRICNEVLNLSFMRINTCVCTSSHGLLNSLNAPRMLVDSLIGLHSALVTYRVFQTELYNGIPNVTVWRVLRQYLYLKTNNQSIIVQDIERWIVGTNRMQNPKIKFLVKLPLPSNSTHSQHHSSSETGQ